MLIFAGTRTSLCDDISNENVLGLKRLILCATAESHQEFLTNGRLVLGFESCHFTLAGRKLALSAHFPNFRLFSSSAVSKSRGGCSPATLTSGFLELPISASYFLGFEAFRQFIQLVIMDWICLDRLGSLIWAQVSYFLVYSIVEPVLWGYWELSEVKRTTFIEQILRSL